MSRIPRFILELEPDGELTPESTLTICGPTGELHHAINVLRLKAGDEIEILDRKREILALCAFTEKCERGLRAVLKSTTHLATQRQLRLILGAPKRQVLERVVEKLVELGVSDLVLFSADRSQQYDVAGAASRLKRLESIAQAAAKQSGNGIPLRISTTGKLGGTLDSLGLGAPKRADEKRIICSLFSPTQTLIQALWCRAPLQVSEDTKKNQGEESCIDANSLSNSLEKSPPYADLTLIVGPEGGLSEIEILTATKLGFEPVSLGSAVLRVETAVVLACGIAAIA